jgi:hypothetical protein
MTQQKEDIERTTRIATLSAGIDGINQAVRALFSYKDSATYKDLAKGANLHPVYMSQCLSASRDVGLAELAGKRGLYKLTKNGEEYARFLSYGEEDKAREVLKGILLKHPSWSEIMKFLRMGYKQERSALSLVADVEGKLGKHWTQSLRSVYANNYVSVLKSADLVDVSGENIVSKVSELGEPQPIKPSASTEMGTRQPQVAPPSSEEYSEFSIPDSFKVFVRRTVEALSFFEGQVKEGSIFVPWIQHEKSKVTTNLKKPTETTEARGQS